MCFSSFIQDMLYFFLFFIIIFNKWLLKRKFNGNVLASLSVLYIFFSFCTSLFCFIFFIDGWMYLCVRLTIYQKSVRVVIFALVFDFLQINTLHVMHESTSSEPFAFHTFCFSLLSSFYFFLIQFVSTSTINKHCNLNSSSSKIFHFTFQFNRHKCNGQQRKKKYSV